MAYPPDSAEFDHIQAYRYVSTGKRPRGWIPPSGLGSFISCGVSGAIGVRFCAPAAAVVTMSGW